jgi:carbon-monoxide dehydrogenase large subunit
MAAEPVVLVVAETAAQALDAASAVRIEIDPLPCVVHVEDAIAAGAPTLWHDAPDNVAIR